jgi:hypothetical protein
MARASALMLLLGLRTVKLFDASATRQITSVAYRQSVLRRFQLQKPCGKDLVSVHDAAEISALSFVSVFEAISERLSAHASRSVDTGTFNMREILRQL